MIKIDVIIATFGDYIWQEKAKITRDSVSKQTLTPNQIHMIHGTILT